MLDFLLLYTPKILLICLASVAITLLSLRRLIKNPLVVVEPSQRHSHTYITPSGGGLSIFIAGAITIPWLLTTTPAEIFLNPWVRFLIASLLLSSISFYDDYIKGVRIEFRLVTHILCALMITGIPLSSAQWVGLLFTVVIINSANFVDGLNGLWAGSWLICILSSCFAFSHIYPFSISFLLPFLPLICAVIVFFYYNFFRGKIFMGDVGSTLLGFTLAFLANYVHLRSEVVVWGITREGAIMLIPLSFLAFDVLFTIISRLINKRGVSLPHKDYLFHYLLESGLSHRCISSIYFTLSLVMVALTQLYLFGLMSFFALFIIYITIQLIFVSMVFWRRAMAR